MNRVAARRQLARDGWLHTVSMVLPVLVLGRVAAPLAEWGLALFAAGLVSLFFSLPAFTAFKHALIAAEQALDGSAEPSAWAQLRRVRRRALLVASLPAWFAAAGTLAGMEPVAQLLLVFGSLALLVLYRIPRQLH
ncbi:major facilitator superfamily permease [Pseudomonas sp. BAY1663]|uniref:MFS transporter n=1 Tax=Stutzerimonas stutzeri TaxID=316 RepID=A0A2N8STK9_STUST|nr:MULTISPECIES: hypothetical protein [Pseudomonadaceae]EXF45567.1 major facilitator superfamily permease [Pseudomonas sp. BAY1663]MCQ4325834.1 hypothetical protein [Stutzerimonas stutzeri]PNG05832.1 hypothetical protein CXK94_19225 [Stutzerimonas stutzeri]